MTSPAQSVFVILFNCSDWRQSCTGDGIYFHASAVLPSLWSRGNLTGWWGFTFPLLTEIIEWILHNSFRYKVKLRDNKNFPTCHFCPLTKSTNGNQPAGKCECAAINSFYSDSVQTCCHLLFLKWVQIQIMFYHMIRLSTWLKYDAVWHIMSVNGNWKQFNTQWEAISGDINRYMGLWCTNN